MSETGFEFAGSCEGCPFFRWVKEVDPWTDKVTRVQLCTNYDEGVCPADVAPGPEVVKPCPTCGRDIDGYEDCPHCLEIEIAVGTQAAEIREWERKFLANS